MYKVGKESFTRFGPEAVRRIHRRGSEVFLDLKYHDIPRTVEGAANAAASHGVYMFNVHAQGCSAMLDAAMNGAASGAKEHGFERPKVIGVTLLTSIDEETMNRELLIHGSAEDYVLHLAQNCQKAGLDGIVCSAKDLASITEHLPDDFMYVTPGVKGPNTGAGDDQKRVMTPGNAIDDGSSILVVGSAITKPDTPEGRLQAGKDVLEDIAKYL